MFGVQEHTEWWAWGSGMEGQLWLGGVLQRGVRRQQRGPVGVGQAESSGERPRARLKSFSFEESQALISSSPGKEIQFLPSLVSSRPREGQRLLQRPSRPGCGL